MALKARLVLEDAKHAIDKHSEDSQGADFRVSWLAVLTLLRSVGHVLDKEDGKTSQAMKAAVQYKHEETKRLRPPIFWEFINTERNRFLKNRDIRIKRIKVSEVFRINGKSLQLQFDVGNNSANAPSIESIVVSGQRTGSAGASTGELKSTITDGFFAGRNEKEVALEAYEWWVAYLDDVERIANEG